MSPMAHAAARLTVPVSIVARLAALALAGVTLLAARSDAAAPKLSARTTIASASVLSTVVAPPPAIVAFRPTTQTPPADPADGAGVVRGRPVIVQAEALRAAQTGQTLQLDCFEDARFTAVLERVEPRGGDTISYRGRLIDGGLGTLLLVLHKGVVAGVIERPNLTWFQIVALGGGFHSVQEMDPALLMECGGGVVPDDSPVADVHPGGDAPAASRLSDAGAEGDALTIIDVLVVYTPQAMQKAGGREAVEARAQLSVEKTNLAYENSGILARLRLVHTGEVSYTEPASSDTSYRTMLDAITNNGDGQMDEVHAWRATYGADMVSLLVGDTESCGIAWIMTSLSTGFARNAFSVVNVDCAASYYSMAHEMGHNQGCHHARGDGGVNPVGMYPYSNGWRFTGNSGTQWRTVMAYAPGTRIPYFSNPEVLYDGQPTGVPVGNTNQANNALDINNAATTVASWQVSTTIPVISPDGFSLVSEGLLPANGGIDPSELVTVNFGLRNTGSSASVNVTATLLPTGGIIPITSSASYGDLASGAPGTARPFQFMAQGACGSSVTATLSVKAGTTDLGTISFPLRLGALDAPGAEVLEIGSGIPLIDGMTMSRTVFSTSTGVVTGLKVRLRLDHTYDSDLTITLIGPNGASVDLVNGTGGSGENFGTGSQDCDGTPTVFDDAAATSISTGTAPFVGTYRPLSPLSVFAGSAVGGPWTLRATDDSAGDTGMIYCCQLIMSTGTFACSTSAATLADVGTALRCAAGLALTDDTSRLDVAGGPSAGRLDMADAISLARRVALNAP